MEALKDKIQKEVNLGRIAGPFKCLLISNLQVSPCGIVPKSDGVTWRLILQEIEHPIGKHLSM
jgi:hypothetical protein